MLLTDSFLIFLIVVGIVFVFLIAILPKLAPHVKRAADTLVKHDQTSIQLQWLIILAAIVIAIGLIIFLIIFGYSLLNPNTPTLPSINLSSPTPLQTLVP